MIKLQFKRSLILNVENDTSTVTARCEMQKKAEIIVPPPSLSDP